MNLAFNFDNRLFWIQNFLPKNLYKEMYVNFIKNRNKLNLKKTIVTWPTYREEVDDMSESYCQRDYNQNLVDYLFKYHTLLKHQQYVNLKDKHFKSHLRKHSYGQHLTWHNDGKDEGIEVRHYAATFYFNKTWGDSWGGELMFRSSKGSGFIPIVGNSVVITETGLEHKVCSNLKKTHPRLSIQTWVNSYKSKEQNDKTSNTR